MAAIVFGNLGFDVGPRKLEVFRVDREDLPYLTFSWGNRSGEIDVHLTSASPRDENEHKPITKIHEPILKIQESKLKASVGDLITQIWELVQKNPMQMVLCVNHKWLASRGYILVGPRDEGVTRWLERVLPKKRGKYRLDEAVFAQLPKMAFYKPTARRLAKLGEEGQVCAVCRKGPQRGTVLVLQRLDQTPAPPSWLAFDCADMDKLIRPAKRLIAQWLASLAPGVWKRIHYGLQLQESGF